MAQRKIPMTMQDWEARLNCFIEATDREVLQDASKVTAEIAKVLPKASFKSTASCRTSCLKATSTGSGNRSSLQISR